MLKFILLMLVSSRVHAFPEMIRHNYVNCTSCHVSPAGGGLLSTYGRSISKELLSRWSYEGEENVLHGAIANEKVINWLNGSQEIGFNIGGDIRYIEVFQDNSAVEKARFFAMQREIEGAFRFKNLTLVSTFGPQYHPNETDKFDARRFYAMYQILDSTSVRVGRFMPIYGLMIPDHFANVKRGLGFDQGRERNTAEVNFIQDAWNGTLSYAKSPKSVSDAAEESAISAQVNYSFLDSYKVGVSYWNGDFENSKRSIYGVQGMIGFTHEIYFLNEIDYQVRELPTGDQKGLYYFQKLGYEFTRGIHAILQLDGSQSNLDANNTKTYAYGAGFNFYPRPHIEVQGIWSRLTTQFPTNEESDFAHLILHYYF